jgi:hypothetical protein
MPWYKNGTVTVVQNSNVVTGAGTAFASNGRVGDAFLGPDGRWYEVVNISSETVLAISPVYQSATNGAGAYALAPMQGYVKDSADALRGLVNQFGQKMAALGTTGNYDTLPLNKGGTGVAADSNATLLSSLGAMPLAGGVALNPVFGSLRAAVTGATPNAQGAYIGWNETNGSGMSGAVSYTCNQGGGTGGFSWRTVNANNSAGGPFMTYSYAGVLNVPAGIQLGGKNIVESGSNANGSYVRFADGTQECWLRNLGFGPAGANVTASAFWTPPIAFIGNTATVVATLQFAESSDAFTCSRLSANVGTNGAVTVTANFSVNQVYRIGLIAKGRWY